MKTVFALFALLVIIIIAITASQGYLKNNPIFLFNSTTATIDDQKFKLLVSKSEKEKQIGLSEKSSLSQDVGMLFVFDKPDYYTFWMKNMKFPIDMIFINDNKIVKIYKNLQPPTSSEENIQIYKSDSPADKVLEITAGLSDKYNFKEGDTVKIENL